MGIQMRVFIRGREQWSLVVLIEVLHQDVIVLVLNGIQLVLASAIFVQNFLRTCESWLLFQNHIGLNVTVVSAVDCWQRGRDVGVYRKCLGFHLVCSKLVVSFLFYNFVGNVVFICVLVNYLLVIVHQNIILVWLFWMFHRPLHKHPRISIVVFFYLLVIGLILLKVIQILVFSRCAFALNDL